MDSMHVAVLGVGMTGMATVDFLLANGYKVSVFDTRQSPPGEDKLDKNIDLFKGELCGEQLSTFPLIVSSPGIALSTPALQFALKAGCEIVGDIELFARELKSEAFQHAKCVTITGSNGKSTVTSLLGEMASEANIKVAVGGNIGIPALALLSPEIELYILELSSFQLETTSSLNADIATILNLSEDHLDRYTSYQHYIDTKHIIYEQARVALVNSGDSHTFARSDEKTVRSFGFNHADYQIKTDEKHHYLAKGDKQLMDVSGLKLSGKHNWLNALAALALGEAVGLPSDAMLSTLTTYTGLDHRCEYVADVNGVRWINDSKATNIGATQAALLGLADTIQGNVHLILGGEGKGADFNELIAVLPEVKGTICCIGIDADKIVEVIPRAMKVKNMDIAVHEIAKHASEGDLVILSPACASLDMYPNFMARGDHFKSIVKSLVADSNL